MSIDFIRPCSGVNSFHESGDITDVPVFDYRLNRSKGRLFEFFTLYPIACGHDVFQVRIET